MEKGVNGSEPAEIEFRPVEESDFPTLTAWLAKPHVRRFYQKTPVTLEQVALEVRAIRPRRGAADLPPGLSIEGSRTTGRCVSESPHPLIASP